MLRRGDELPTWAVGALRHMDASLGDLSRTVAALVDYLQVAATEPRLRTLPLTPLVCEAWDEALARHPDSAATLDAGALPDVRADPDLLRMLLVALLDNALRFRAEADDSAVRVSSIESDATWDIRVEDLGLGIEIDQLTRAFEPFERLHAHHDRPGAGMGLTLARRVARMHGGDIDLTSRPGRGTTVAVRLPRREAV